ncbi:hypothetical protein C5B85_18290 [Pseudoclavibacter sp. AY1F1]|uniref:hypothetical protein n=1 Tax=Pseudoclavibacter sp. AY1F1 TaxID=2080583 RepID=UPI000CE8A02C|nr:hypothetical protein [Pseudoclavibacter sp. AY1F1]PPF41871.1 hypothetical protein C5B85_18290 [Pseudoclavibacter sp. AY1F1]
MTDQERRLETMMGELDPVRGAEDGELAPRHQALLARIIATPATRRAAETPSTPSRTRSGSWVLLQRTATPIFTRVAVSVVVLLVIVGLMMTPTNTAAARTPPPLEFQPTELTHQEVRTMLFEKLTANPAVTEAQRYARSVGWYLQYTEGDEDTSTAISPQVAELSWGEDRSGRFTLTAGVPYKSVEAPQLVPEDAPAPGTVIVDEIYAAGEYDVPTSTTLPGDSPAQLREALEEYGGTPQASGFEVIEAISGLLAVWTLTDRQHGALLEILLSQPDVRVYGTTTDRAGRPVIGIAADSTSGNRDVLLISTETGRVVGLETLRTTDWGDIPAGATTAYTIWETTP